MPLQRKAHIVSQEKTVQPMKFDKMNMKLLPKKMERIV